MSAVPLVRLVIHGVSFDTLRFLVKVLDADVNGARFEDGATPLLAALQIGDMVVIRFLVHEGADISHADHLGATPLLIAAQEGHLAVARYLVKELGADIDQGSHSTGATPLYIAAQEGNLALVRCIVKELGANVNKTKQDGTTPLMVAARFEREDVVAFLIKYGANTKHSALRYGTAADISRRSGASAGQTQYLDARTHCANTGCDGAGVKKCAGCLKVYYCARECQLGHWATHKAACRKSADIKADKEKLRTCRSQHK
jgi:ankyrin repeat protein